MPRSDDLNGGGKRLAGLINYPRIHLDRSIDSSIIVVLISLPTDQPSRSFPLVLAWLCLLTTHPLLTYPFKPSPKVLFKF